MTEPIQGEIGKRASAASAELEDGWQEYASRIKRAKANIPEDKDIEIQEFEADPADFDESMNDDEELEGAELAEDIDPKLLEAARKEEIAFMVNLGMWERATYEECKLNTGRGPVSTRWVDVDKGRNGEHDVRSRLVARDFKVRGDGREFDVFAAMPPLEAKRLLFRMAVVNGCVGGG